ncbi:MULTISPECIES: PAS domain-containing sensor histidine kinase [unclassified Clostridium]|uniref:PAS domain-containing sensor histidine kinase n=1 Tax=unclassified Clostridium TaxID=2614128 RepID=UPI001C8CD484|nr:MULTISPECIES: PAS domain-containing sensor histidine kinase [unclassified Clostridium]MBX9138803.1 PAS domain-containing sensor histidine kinase [Clostridium sp. K12(2020)]MBX9145566.1 PAS domain-containing sensor histidine kinase [Clostridium sp. K13]
MNEYKKIFEKMPIAIIYAKYEKLTNGSLKMSIEYVNNKVLSILDLNSEELINKDFLNIFPEFKNDIVISEENLTYIKYIKKLMNFIKITVQKVDDKNVLLYLEECILKEIYNYIKNTYEFFFVKDINNRYVDGSDLFKKLSGYNGKDINGLTDVDLYERDIGNLYIKSSEDFIRENRPYSKKICKLNDNVYFLHRYAVYCDNKIIGIIGAFENVIGKLEEVAKENMLLRVLNNNIPYHIVCKDTNGIYLDCNNSFLKDLNLTREEVIGKDASSIDKLMDIHENTLESDLEVINNKKRKVYIEQVTIKDKVKMFEIIKEPFFDSYGNLVGIIVIGRDVSHRTEMERLRLEFFANLSHELRTPLNLIFSSLQTLELLEKDSLEKNVRLKNYIEIINQNSKRLLRLVNNLIDSTKFDCGFYKYNPKNQDIVCFMENIAMSVAEFAKQNDINLIFDTNVEEKVIAFDLEKLERTILNLLSNSIKYTNSPGKIEVILNDCGDTFNITVKDNGIGIPMDKLPVIFDRFKQVENRLRKRSEGSGIGLSLVKDLVKIQGATIKVKSEVGVGSEFTVKLPCKVLKGEDYVNKTYCDYSSNGLVTRINIEFSDIYI